jgi:hypothetical protein
VPYQGPETLVEFLRRAGGLKPGAALDRVHVVRPHVADGGSPEVFDIDLEAIVTNSDNRTNIRVQPFDQVYVDESRGSIWVRLVAPWLQPLWKSLLGLGDSATASPTRESETRQSLKPAGG